jgi:hypothetical protein
MTDWTETSTLAYCGFICAGCAGLKDGCAGCRAGGGDEGCTVRSCCVEHGYAGCWECAEMPCDRGSFGNADFRGTTTALVRAAQRLTPQGMLARARARLGDLIDYAALSGKSEQELLALLTNEPGSQP